MTNMVVLALAAVVNTATNVASLHANSIGEILLAAGGCMSRPVETVVIATNVTVDVGQKCNGCASWAWAQGSTIIPGHDPFNCPEVKGMLPGTKRETTEIVEVKTLHFTWESQERTLTSLRTLETRVRRWVRKEDWVEEGK